jgi:hypothetical protein
MNKKEDNAPDSSEAAGSAPPENVVPDADNSAMLAADDAVLEFAIMRAADAGRITA